MKDYYLTEVLSSGLIDYDADKQMGIHQKLNSIQNYCYETE